MYATPLPSLRGRPFWAAWALALTLAFPSPLPAGNAATPGAASPRPGVAASVAAGPLFAEGWLKDLTRDFNSMLGTRRGMTVVGSLFMLIALWIIWYRRN